MTYLFIRRNPDTGQAEEIARVSDLTGEYTGPMAEKMRALVGDLGLSSWEELPERLSGSRLWAVKE